MPQPNEAARTASGYKRLMEAIFVACALAAGAFWLQGDYGCNLSDEGFLWYGAIQTLSGQVPIRDFQSYDPGRYYWIALFFKFFGTQFWVTRLSEAAFQALGLALGYWTVRCAGASRFAAGLFTTALLLWMLIPYRQFEYTLVIACVFFTHRLLDRPSPGRHAAAGAFAGAVFFFGLNHGFYAVFALMAAVCFAGRNVARGQRLQKQTFFCLGVAAGLLPAAAMMAIPGYAAAYGEVLSGLARNGTNTALDIPWPWMVSWEQVCLALPPGPWRLVEYAHRLSNAWLFTLLPFLWLFLLYQSLRRDPRSPGFNLMAAGVIVTGVYAHHVYSRADIFHWAEASGAIFSAAAGWALCHQPRTPGARWGKFLCALLAVLSLFSAWLLNGFFFKFAAAQKPIVYATPASGNIRIFAGEAQLYRSVETAVSRHVPSAEPLWILTDWPGFYPILGRRSPVHEIFYLRPASEKAQRQAIQQLEEKSVNWALINDPNPDGPKRRWLRRTHPLLAAYLEERFEQVPEEAIRSWAQLLKRKKPLVPTDTPA